MVVNIPEAEVAFTLFSNKSTREREKPFSFLLYLPLTLGARHHSFYGLLLFPKLRQLILV